MYQTNFFRSIHKTYSLLEKSNNSSEYISALKETIGFVLSGNYINGNCPEYFKDLIAGKSTDYVVRTFNTTERAVTKRVKRHSDRLYDLYGKDYFTLYQGIANLEEIKKRNSYAIQNAKFSLKDVLLPSIERQYSLTSVPDDVVLADCGKEYEFLCQFSPQRVENTLSTLDSSKLAYVISILEGSNGTQKETNTLRAHILNDSSAIDLGGN